MSDMLNEIDNEPGGSDHHCGSGAGIFHHAVSVEVFEAAIRQQSAGFVEVIHIHADRLNAVHRQMIALGDVQIKAIGNLHANARDVELADVLLGVAALEAQRFKQLNDGLRVLCDDLRVKGRDLHLFIPRIIKE